MTARPDRDDSELCVMSVLAGAHIVREGLMRLIGCGMTRCKRALPNGRRLCGITKCKGSLAGSTNRELP